MTNLDIRSGQFRGPSDGERPALQHACCGQGTVTATVGVFTCLACGVFPRCGLLPVTFPCYPSGVTS
ncbi:MAG: hypothetical protein ACTSP4_07850 [Candidatus Hodarchaeales archaeon]